MPQGQSVTLQRAKAPWSVSSNLYFLNVQDSLIKMYCSPPAPFSAPVRVRGSFPPLNSFLPFKNTNQFNPSGSFSFCIPPINWGSTMKSKPGGHQVAQGRRNRDSEKLFK